jgi:hypothetical protein
VADLTPRPSLEYIRDRLRLVLVEDALINDEDLLTLLSRGYQHIVERARSMPRLVTLSYTGSSWYSLSDDVFQVLAVFDSYGRLPRLATSRLVDTSERAYFLQPGLLGFSQPADAGSFTMLAAMTPEPFSTWASVPGPELPAEFHYLLVHYARWRVYELARGAGGIGQAQWERGQLEQGIQKLRIQAGSVDAAEPVRIPIARTRAR